jgi:outer membrane protein assembly factor BamB
MDAQERAMDSHGWKNLSLQAALLWMLTGCASVGSTSLEQSTEKGMEAAATKPQKLEDLADASEHGLRLWQWNEVGELVLVYADGLVGRLVPDGSQVVMSRPEYGRYLRGLSKDGRVAWIDDGMRTTIIDVRDSGVSLPLNEVGLMDHVALSASGTTFFGVDRDGQLHRWDELPRRLATPEANLETLIERQLPDATAHLSVASPLHVANRGELVFGDTSGRLSRWHPDEPEAITRLAELGAPVVAVAEGNDFYVATARNGRLAVVDIEYGENDWSATARAELATAHPAWAGRFAYIAEGRLRAADAASGDELWSVALPGLAVCGLTMSGDGRAIAVCVGNQLALVSREDGSLLKVVGRTGDDVKVR